MATDSGAHNMGQPVRHRVESIELYSGSRNFFSASLERKWPVASKAVEVAHIYRLGLAREAKGKVAGMVVMKIAILSKASEGTRITQKIQAGKA